MNFLYGGIAVVSGIVSYKFNNLSNRLHEAKNDYLNSVISSDDKTHIDSVDNGTEFILQHNVPLDGKKYAVLSVWAERVQQVYTQKVIPYSEVKNTCKSNGIVESEVTNGYQTVNVPINALVNIFEGQFASYENFGCDFLKKMNSVKFIFNTKPILLTGDYNNIRDMLKSDYNHTLWLSNVGNTSVCINDCIGAHLYFGVKKIGGSVCYDIVATSPTEVANSKYNSYIEDTTVGAVIFGAFAVVTACCAFAGGKF